MSKRTSITSRTSARVGPDAPMPTLHAVSKFMISKNERFFN